MGQVCLSTGESDLLSVQVDLCWAEFDGRWVVFQSANGLVCELDEFSALVLSIIEDQAVLRKDLFGKLSNAMQDAGGGPTVAQFAEAVDALARAGVVEVSRRRTSACS